MAELRNILTYFLEVIHSFVTSIGITDSGIAYALALVVYTLILKTIVMPLYVYQLKSTRGMSELSPKLKELQEKYKNNPQKMQEEQLKLYKELGVNPFKGCLPMFVQMPIFIAMFSVISAFTGFNGLSFLWIPDLAKPDPYYILPVLVAIVQFLSMRVMSRNMDKEQRSMQNKMGIGMSVMFLFICINYKAALAIYFVASSVIQGVQSLMINWYLDKDKAKKDAIKKIEEEKKLAKEAEEKAARREEFKKKKKAKSDANSTSSSSTDATKPKKKKKPSSSGQSKSQDSDTQTSENKPKKKKRTEESSKLKSENKDDKVVE